MTSYGTQQLGAAPPTYDQVTDPNAPPPTYESLYGELRQVNSPKGFVGVVAKCVGVVVGTVTAAVVICVLNFIPIIMIIVGSINWSECPVQPWVPRWLVVSGVLALLKSATNMYYRASHRRASDDGVDPVNNVKPNPFDGLLGCLIMGWFIAGSVWVYRSWRPEFSDSSSPHYCDNLTYMVAFVVISVTYLLALLSIVLFCCCGCCILLCLNRDDRPQTDAPDV